MKRRCRERRSLCPAPVEMQVCRFCLFLQNLYKIQSMWIPDSVRLNAGWILPLLKQARNMKCCVWNTKSSEWVFSEMFWEGSSSPLWPSLTISKFVWIWNFLDTSISCWRCYWKFGWSVASWTHKKNIVGKFRHWTFQNTKQNVLTLSELGERAMWSWRQFFKRYHKSYQIPSKDH